MEVPVNKEAAFGTIDSIPDLSTLTVSGSTSETTTTIGTTLTTPQPVPAHRSHDPRNNLKRSDPFQFGSRYLEEGDDVYEFNAWDHVETDETYKVFSEQQYAKQRENPVSDFDKRRFNTEPSKWWNLFYRNNTSNFFKNRKWLQQEFPILTASTQADAPPITILEVGAGAGNTAYPILANNQNPNLKIHACDFSKQAVELIRGNPNYDEKHIQAEVWDLSAPGTLPPGLEEESVDVVMMIFTFSALAPSQWQDAVQNVWRVLRPGGEVLFRDYGRGDLTQVRFKKGRYLDENFYVRGDGTRVYFFEREELIDIWGAGAESSSFEDEQRRLGRGQAPEPPASVLEAVSSEQEAREAVNDNRFEIINLGIDRRLLVNRQTKVKMYRCWMQGRFRKPGGKAALSSAGLMMGNMERGAAKLENMKVMNEGTSDSSNTTIRST